MIGLSCFRSCAKAAHLHVGQPRLIFQYRQRLLLSRKCRKINGHPPKKERQKRRRRNSKETRLQNVRRLHRSANKLICRKKLRKSASRRIKTKKRCGKRNHQHRKNRRRHASNEQTIRRLASGESAIVKREAFCFITSFSAFCL